MKGPIIGTLVSIVYLSGCTGSSNIINPPISENRYMLEDIDSLYFTTSLNGNIIIARQISNEEFLFYRDEDDDGFFDSYGTGTLTKDGEGKIINEWDLPRFKYSTRFITKMR